MKKFKFMPLHELQGYVAHQANKPNPVNDNYDPSDDVPRKKPGPKKGSQFCVRALTKGRLYKRPK